MIMRGRDYEKKPRSQSKIDLAQIFEIILASDEQTDVSNWLIFDLLLFKMKSENLVGQVKGESL